MGKGKRRGRGLKFLSSMKFGMILMAILAIYSTLGTLLPQGNLLGFYEENYSAFTFKLITIFQLDDVYHSIYFVILTILLSVNLLFCSIKRFPLALQQYRKSKIFSSELQKKESTKICQSNQRNSKEILSKLGFKRSNSITVEDETLIYSFRRSVGYFGSFFVHVGLLLVIVAFALGKILGFETYVRGVPGDEIDIENTPYELALQDFDIEYRTDYSIHQYISTVDYKNKDGEILKSGDISVNDPMRVKGYKVYQSGTGWMMNMIVDIEEEEIKNQRFYQSGIIFVDEEDIAIEFRNFYPDFLFSEGKAYTKTPFLNNPRYLYMIYEEGKSVYMDVAAIGETISYKNIRFRAYEPKLYTVLQVVKDPGAVYAGIGGIIMILGLLLTFYYVPQYIILKEERDGWTLYGDTLKNREAFKLSIEEKMGENEIEGGKH